jgi:hypothetical protein
VHVERAAAQVRQHHGRDPGGVPEQLPLRHRLLAVARREQHLVEVRHLEPAAVHLPRPAVRPEVVERGELVVGRRVDLRRAQVHRRLGGGPVGAPQPVGVGLHLVVGAAAQH